MDPTSGISLADLLIGVAGLFMAVVGWLGARLHNKVDKLSENKLDKIEYKEQLVDLKKEIRNSTDRQTQMFVQLFSAFKEKE